MKKPNIKKRTTKYKNGKDSIWDKYSKFNDSFASIPVKFLDPTGISSWKDVYDAWTDKDLNVANALLETAGAVPLIGKIAKIGKAAKILSKDKNLFKTQDYILRGIGTSHDVQQQIKKYKDGKDGIELKPVKNWKYVDDGSGNMNIVDTNTGQVGTLAIEDPVITTRDPRKYDSSFDGSFRNLYNTTDAMTGGLFTMLPVLGDAMDVGMVANDVADKNYAQAGIGAGMLLLPNLLEKPLRYIGRGIKNSIRNAIINREFKKAINNSNIENKVLSDFNGYKKINLKRPYELKYDNTEYPTDSYLESQYIDPLSVAIDNSQIVDKNGNINFKNIKRELNNFYDQNPELKSYFPKSSHRTYQTIDRNGIPKTDSKSYSLLQHSLGAAKQAQRSPLPQGTTRQQFVQSALFHDIGKMIPESQKDHADLGVSLLKNSVQKVDDDVLKSIALHMDDGGMLDYDPLTRALHFVDVTHGMSPELGFHNYSHLSYPRQQYPTIDYYRGSSERDELKNINHILKTQGYKTIPLDASEQQIQDAIEDRVLQGRTFLRSVRYPSYSKHLSPEANSRNLNNALQQSIRYYGDTSQENVLKSAAETTSLDPTGYGRQGLFSVDDRHGILPVHKHAESRYFGINPETRDGLYVSNSNQLANNYLNSSSKETPVKKFILRKPKIERNAGESNTSYIMKNRIFPIETSSRSGGLSSRNNLDLMYKAQTGRSLMRDMEDYYVDKFGIEKFSKNYIDYNNVNDPGVGDTVNSISEKLKQRGGKVLPTIYGNGDTYSTSDLDNLNILIKYLDDIKNGNFPKDTQINPILYKYGSSKLVKFLENKNASQRNKILQKMDHSKILNSVVSNMNKKYNKGTYNIALSRDYKKLMKQINKPTPKVEFMKQTGTKQATDLPEFLDNILYTQELQKPALRNSDFAGTVKGYFQGRKGERLLNSVDDSDVQYLLNKKYESTNRRDRTDADVELLDYLLTRISE